MIGGDLRVGARHLSVSLALHLLEPLGGELAVLQGWLAIVRWRVTTVLHAEELGLALIVADCEVLSAVRCFLLVGMIFEQFGGFGHDLLLDALLNGASNIFLRGAQAEAYSDAFLVEQEQDEVLQFLALLLTVKTGGEVPVYALSKVQVDALLPQAGVARAATVYCHRRADNACVNVLERIVVQVSVSWRQVQETQVQRQCILLILTRLIEHLLTGALGRCMSSH